MCDATTCGPTEDLLGPTCGHSLRVFYPWLAGYWIVLFRLVKMPPNALPDMSSYPRMTVALIILMGSLVAPFMEEAGFRGYFQVALEREVRGWVAVTVSSLVFAFAHFAHGILWPKLLVYFLVGVAFGTTAYLANSTLPAILPHMIGDLTFFTLVWPHDAARRLVLDSGTDNWFWIHVTQAIVFTVLAIWAFQRLARECALRGWRPLRGVYTASLGAPVGRERR
ncbi:CPBP family intramembrane glutamic endopeptidase [Tunturiibacter gelidoferens]|uniref:Membrane protease YdiL (CAAX protease family) n=1 Tax=Tunturiibacter gelidiferens TaxID=3069689 RepID=A0ACC5P0N8_9BACT|nr:CPBP family intramembrane glutamic endopeptidase [Edaphobacter lichenicola]MBB5340387.1 membrane protease YdiL (CAAX protease family) [Edaphobacter lichenicola]